MSDEDVIAALQAQRASARAVQLAELLRQLTDRELTQSLIVFFFKRAFPDIPLRVLLDAGAWTRVSNGELSDDGFNALLQPWLGTHVPSS
jgi:hypothetical protein